MQPVNLVGAEVTWAGAVSLEAGDGWFRPWRIPYKQLELFPPDGIGGRAINATGVRLAFLSDTRRVEMEAEVVNEGAVEKVDLLADNELVCSKPVSPGGAKVSLEGAPEGMKRLEVWLPHWETKVRALAVEDGARVERFDDRRPRWIAWGSSITQCRSARSPARTWPAVVARSRDLHLTSLGFGGNCHAEPMVARLIRDLPADLVSLSLGINIQGASSLSPRTFLPAIIGIVEIIRERHPDIPIVLASPIISPPRETTRNAVGLSLSDMRRATAEAADILVRNGAGPLYYVDGLKILGPDETRYLPDQLHPSAEGYLVYAKNYEREVFSLFSLPPETKDAAPEGGQ